MEFRLIYRGSLPAQGSGTGGSRVKEKHAIRRQIHSQLRELWHGNQFLSRYVHFHQIANIHVPAVTEGPGKNSGVDIIAKNFTKFGYRFVPLITREFGIACSLEILFLRRDGPGNLIKSGGDIDNRLKVLFDALTVPEYNNQVEDMPPVSGEDPFFCLLEDDTLITDVRVTTDRLLLPMEKDEHVNDVHLTLHVKTKIVDINKGFQVFA